MMYRDRSHAGRVLAGELERWRNHPDVIVLGLPRGGVPVAYEVARSLKAPLDVFIVRKLGVPYHEELAMGAIASGGVTVLNEEVVRGLGIDEVRIQGAASREQIELERREREYRGNRAPLLVDGKVVIIVDDGLATGSTMRAAVTAIKLHRPKRIIVAVPVASKEAVRLLESEGAEVICPLTPDRFMAVGLHYQDFEQTSDAEVRDCLRAGPPPGGSASPPPP